MSLAVADRLLADVAHRFNAKVRGGKFRAKCPAHADNAPSLVGQLGEYGDRVVLHCFAGCVTEDVLAAVGLDVKDLFLRNAGGPPRPASVLVAARTLKPDRREWALSLLFSKLPGVAGDILADPGFAAVFPTSSPQSRRRRVQRLAAELGVSSRKENSFGRGRWVWSLKMSPSQKVQQTTKGDNTNPDETRTSIKGDSGPEDDGQNVALAPSQKVQETDKGDTPAPVRYENVVVVEGESEKEREGENVANVDTVPSVPVLLQVAESANAGDVTNVRANVFEADAEGQAAPGEVLSMFGGRVVGIRPDDGGERAEDLELRRAAGCSVCGDWRTGALYVGGVCSKCFKASPRFAQRQAIARAWAAR